MKRDNWTVGQEGIRPAGELDRCFYCGKLLGDTHKETCVVRERTVVIRAIIEYTISVPEFWTQEDVEFHRNESSWCANNMLNEINHLNANDNCMCDITTFEYVREATEADEVRSNLFVKDFES